MEERDSDRWGRGEKGEDGRGEVRKSEGGKMGGLPQGDKWSWRKG